VWLGRNETKHRCKPGRDFHLFANPTHYHPASCFLDWLTNGTGKVGTARTWSQKQRLTFPFPFVHHPLDISAWRALFQSSKLLHLPCVLPLWRWHNFNLCNTKPGMIKFKPVEEETLNGWARGGNVGSRPIVTLPKSAQPCGNRRLLVSPRQASKI